MNFESNTWDARMGTSAGTGLEVLLVHHTEAPTFFHGMFGALPHVCLRPHANVSHSFLHISTLFLRFVHIWEMYRFHIVSIRV